MTVKVGDMAFIVGTGENDGKIVSVDEYIGNPTGFFKCMGIDYFNYKNADIFIVSCQIGLHYVTRTVNSGPIYKNNLIPIKGLSEEEIEEIKKEYTEKV